MTKEHPEDRIADANEDYENINTDWSKAYAAENKIDSEISVVKAYNRKRKLKRNKVDGKKRSIAVKKGIKSFPFNAFSTGGDNFRSIKRVANMYGGSWRYI